LLRTRERLAGIIADIVQAVGIDVGDCYLGAGPDICALGDEAVAKMKRAAQTEEHALQACLSENGEQIGMAATIAQQAELIRLQAAELAALKQSGLALPARCNDQSGERFEAGWDACLDEIARLNASRDEWPKEQCPVTGAITDVDPADLIAAAKTPAPANGATYPIVRRVRAHLYTCACVTGDSGVCDCGAVVDGVPVEVKPDHSADDKMVRVTRELLQAAWRHMPSPDSPDIDPQHAEELSEWHLAASALLAGGAE
jgi:hypothetical protein